MVQPGVRLVHRHLSSGAMHTTRHKLSMITRTVSHAIPSLQSTTNNCVTAVTWQALFWATCSYRSIESSQHIKDWCHYYCQFTEGEIQAIEIT